MGFEPTCPALHRTKRFRGAPVTATSVPLRAWLGKVRRKSLGRALSPPALLEETLQERASFVGQDSRDHREMVRQPEAVQRDLRFYSTEFGLRGTVDEPPDAGVGAGAGAHQAGFDGGVEVAPGEAVVAEPLRGGADCEHLGVGGGVAGLEDAVAGGGEDFAVLRDDGADGDFAVFGRPLGFGEGGAHEGVVEARQSAVFVHESR